MHHCIGRGVIGPWPFVDISDQEFGALTIAKRNIFMLLGVEEKFGMLIDNFVEYERELLNLALLYKISHDLEWSGFQDAKALINRRLANCLTVARLYLDQVRQDVNQAYQNCAVSDRIKEATKKQYDGRLGYRVMEETRNYLQHRSLPITGLQYPSAWENHHGQEFLHHRITPLLSLDQLRENGRFRKAVLEDLERTGREHCEATPFLREYIEGLSIVHQEFRTATSKDIPEWKQKLLTMIERYSAACGEQVKYVVAYAVDGNDTVEEVWISMDGVDRLEEYQRRKLPTNVSRWFVSNAQE